MTGSNLTAGDIMRRDPVVVQPDRTLAELEHAFCQHRVSGFPVVQGDRLVGVVSRADVVRQLSVERSREAEISDYFCQTGPWTENPDDAALMQAETQQVAERLRKTKVCDVMSNPTFIATVHAPVPEIAELLVRHGIHRVPVIDDAALVGIITSLDLVDLIARKVFVGSKSLGNRKRAGE